MFCNEGSSSILEDKLADTVFLRVLRLHSSLVQLLGKVACRGRRFIEVGHAWW